MQQGLWRSDRGAHRVQGKHRIQATQNHGIHGRNPKPTDSPSDSTRPKHRVAQRTDRQKSPSPGLRPTFSLGYRGVGRTHCSRASSATRKVTARQEPRLMFLPVFVITGPRGHHADDRRCNKIQTPRSPHCATDGPPPGERKQDPAGEWDSCDPRSVAHRSREPQ